MARPSDSTAASKGDAFRGMSVTWLLEQWVERQPDKTFVIWAPFDQPARQWTYAEMAREASLSNRRPLPRFRT